jgi:ABC-type glycerol-3-phosphate transport system substrate-binding protein
MSTDEGTRLTRRQMIQALGATAAAGVLAACAAPQPTATPAPQKAAEAPKATEAPKPTTAPAKPAASKAMVMWGLKYDPHITRYNALIKGFKEKTGVDTTLQPQDWPLEVKVAAGMSAGTAPDVCCMMGKVLPPLLVKKAAVDVTDLVYKAVGTDVNKDWYGDGIPCYTYEGKIYGVPTEFSTISLAGAWPTEDKKYNAITADEAKKYPPNTTTRLQAD